MSDAGWKPDHVSELLPELPDELRDACLVGAGSRLVAGVPGHVGRGSPVPAEQVLVEMRDAAADHRREHELRIEALPERRGELGAKAAERRGLIVGQVGDVGGVPIALDVQIAKAGEPSLKLASGDLARRRWQRSSSAVGRPVTESAYCLPQAE